MASHSAADVEFPSGPDAEPPAGDAQRAPRVPDSEVDPEFHLPVRRVGHDEVDEEHLRILVNPFLAIFGFLIWLAALRGVLSAGLNRDMMGPLIPVIGLVFIASLWWLKGLLRFHCLDCGTTDRLSRWRRHACGPSIDRQMAGRRSWLRPPPPFVQFILWLWVLLLIGLAAMTHRGDGPLARAPRNQRPATRVGRKAVAAPRPKPWSP